MAMRDAPPKKKTVRTAKLVFIRPDYFTTATNQLLSNPFQMAEIPDQYERREFVSSHTDIVDYISTRTIEVTIGTLISDYIVNDSNYLIGVKKRLRTATESL